jgi:hypothetical protein
VFAADVNGSIYFTEGTPFSTPYPWFGPWLLVCDDRRTLPGAPVAAVRWKGELAAFMADPSGGVYAARGTRVRWRCWDNVSDGRAAPGSKITAINWTDDQLAVFLIDPNLGAYWTGGAPDTGWGPWAALPPVNTSARSGIAAIQWPGVTTNMLAVFTTAFDTGTVMQSFWDPQQGFGAWTEVAPQSPEFVGASNTAPVTAVAYGGDPPDRVGLFVTDPQGAIYSTWSMGG